MKGHVFYTGDKARVRAIQFARAFNMETIDMTPLGRRTSSWCNRIRKIKMAEEGWTKQEFWDRIGREVWENMSRSFAFSTPTTQKEVYVFIEREYYSEQKKFKSPTASILHTIEHPALKAMGKKIHVYLV